MFTTKIAKSDQIGLPISNQELQHYQLQSKRLLRSDISGGHLTRRRGQSLEFKDFAQYQPGDDIRYVDWRASARLGLPHEWVVKTFVAEQKLKILVSIDNRDSMQLPQPVSKLRHACWLTQAIKSICSNNQDIVNVHPLFGQPNPAISTINRNNMAGKDQSQQLYDCLKQSPGENAPINHSQLAQLTKPAAVWVIISDFYFTAEQSVDRLADLVAKRRAAQNWVIFVDIDSWPNEKAQLGLGARKLWGPGSDDNKQDFLYDVTPEHLLQVEDKIQRHKSHLFQRLGHQTVDASTWLWPNVETMDHPQFFREKFFNDKVLQRLFMRDSV